MSTRDVRTVVYRSFLLKLLTLSEDAENAAGGRQGTALETCHLDVLELFEKRRGRVVALHDVRDDGFGQRLAAAGLADEEERDPQLNANGHHPHVLFQSCVLRDVVLQF